MPEALWPAPAKLNLFLHVLGRTASGHHRIQTLYQLLDWGDTLSIEATDQGRITQRAPVPGIAPDQDLCLRAARLLQQESGSSRGAVIGLHKSIPLGAGLGGGSSDSATVLLVLNRLWGCGLSTQALAELGLRLGADVPLFVHGHTAWGEGIGERLLPMELGETWYVLVFPDLAVSTAEIFHDSGLSRNTRPIDPAGFEMAQSRNDCQAVVLDRYPLLRTLVADLGKWGAPRMTGTGSCFFLPVRDEKRAREVTQALKSRYNVRAVRGVDQSALLAKLSGAG
jgi:4-diphosphocytidyl-2-C-methyl-D-erythritol kinase